MTEGGQVVDLGKVEVSRSYFKRYGDLGVHRTLLRDSTRIKAFWKAICGYKATFKNKIVLDLCAGAGLVSVFCAKAGAKSVFAVESSEVMIPLLHNVVKENGYDQIIQVIHGEPNTVNLPIKADIIICEWTGHFLLHEGFVDTVISAKRFMHSDTIMIPEKATIYYALSDIPSLARDWSSIRGVNLSAVTRKYRSESAPFPLIDVIKEKDVKSNAKIFLNYDLYTVTREEVDYRTLRSVFVARQVGLVEGLCLWWELDLGNEVKLTTSPSAPPTHYKQCFILFPAPIQVRPGTPVGTELTLYKSNTLHKFALGSFNATEMEHDIPCDCIFKRCQASKSIFLELSNSKNA